MNKSQRLFKFKGQEYKSILFINIPNTGGASVKEALIENNLLSYKYCDKNGYDRLQRFTINYDIDNKDTLIFSVIKNPYTWAYSCYHDFNLQNKTNVSFNEFLNIVESKRFFRKTPYIHFFQYFFLQTPLVEGVNVILYPFEKLILLEQDFGITLKKSNKDDFTKEELLNDYTLELQTRVKNIYKKDFDSFLYSDSFDEKFK